MNKTFYSISLFVTQAAFLMPAQNAMSQDTGLGLAPDIPPSPQAAAFNRLGDYQVSNNYGAPDISIPLFEIDFHGYKIPLTLRYEASPMKPGYNYDVTGWGWTLSGNSCVSRTIKDVADECASVPFTLDSFTLSSGGEKEFLYYQNNNLLDNFNFQYDIYNVVLPSGRSIPFFMYKQEGTMQYHTLGMDSNVRISCNYGINSIYSFTVTDESGVVYNFTLPEKAANIFQNDPNADRNVTWLLTSIDIPSKGTIFYHYTETPVIINTQNIVREPVVTVCRLYDSWGIWPNNKKLCVKGSFMSQSPRYEMSFLKRIEYGPSTVYFNYVDDRRHMEEIVVADSGETVRKFTLNVYGSPYDPCWHLNSLVISGEGEGDRLEYGFSYYNNIPGNYTDFWGNLCDAGPSVNGDNGHTLNNYGLDDLGNFNLFFPYDGVGLDRAGIQTQLSLDGMLVQLIESEDGDPGYYYKMKLQTTTGGDTRIPTSPDKHGVLTGISYPNGGSTVFNWECHSFPTATASDGDLVADRRSQRIVNGGGFRIESIKNYDADGQVANEDYYRYGFTLGDIISQDFPLPLPDYLDADNLAFNDTINHHIGCGEAVVDPNLFTFMGGFSYSKSLEPGTSQSYSYSDPKEFRKMLVGQDSRFKNMSLNQGVQGIPIWWEASFSANKFRSLIGGRQPVVYPEITVYHGQPYNTDICKSKTVYRYDIYKQQHSYSQGGNYLTDFDYLTEQDTAYFESLHYQIGFPSLTCSEHPAERHQLKSRSDYSYNAVQRRWELVSEEDYEYKNYETPKGGFVFESFISRENYYPNYNGISYGQIGFVHPLDGTILRMFYKPVAQTLGKSTMVGKSTTLLRQGGTRSRYNTLDEAYSYLYPGVMTSRYYSDMLKNSYSNTYDKVDWYSYVGEMSESNDTVIAAMKSKNMLSSPISAETYTVLVDDPSTLLAGSKIDYAFFGNNILPSRLYVSNGDSYEESIEVLSYDSYGNPTELVDLRTGDANTGIHSVYLWDPSGRYLLAMVRNASLSQIQNASPQLAAATSRVRHAMLQAMLPNALVQTWDYKPLVGVSSHTDASGQTILYEYDGLGRLKKEKRIVNGTSESEILRKYEYNYMNQQSN